ncbi:MAG TPA: hypothetical protein VE755_06235, partial [Myxococcales bacterium]|nr:hypothetical protein [Myxococcales bacterium]
MAQIERVVEVEEVEGAQRPRPTLASRVSDAAAAQLLIFDELPEDERPRPGGRVLLVGIVWGGSTLVELEQVGAGADLSVSRLFDLPESTLPRNFHMVKHVPDGHVVTLPDELHAEVHGGGKVLPLAAKGRRVDAPFRGYAHAIDGDDRLVAQLTPSLTLIARYVRAERQKDRGALKRIDVPFSIIVVVALAALLAFFRMMSSVPRIDFDRDAL